MSHENLNKMALLVANILAIVMVAIKCIAYSLTGSVSILASLADSGMDLLLSFINLLSLRYSLQPADNDHKFGHEAIEDLASIFQAVLMIISALFVIKKAILSFLHPELQVISGVGITIMLITWVITFILVSILMYTYKRTGSVMVKTESLHYVSDILSNAAVLISLWVAKLYNFYLMEQILATIIGLYLLYLAGGLFYTAINNIMGHELPDDIQQKILAAMQNVPQSFSCQAIRTRGIGRRKLVHLTLTFPGDMTIANVHQLSDTLENQIRINIPDADIIIHQEPMS